MAKWTATITNAGLALLNSQVSGDDLTIVSAVSSTTTTPTDQLASLTEMTNVKQNLTLGSATMGTNTFSIPVSLSNTGLTEAYNLKQIGLYAQDPDDISGKILFAVAQIDVARTINLPADAPGYTLEIELNFQNTNNSNVVVNIDTSNMLTHMNNNDIHVTASDKSKWNNYENTLKIPAILQDDTFKVKQFNLNADKAIKFNSPSLPYDFNNGSAVVLNGEIHILGSSKSESTYTKHYKWNGTSWTSVSTLPYNFYQGSAVVLDGEIHILGSGENSYYQYHYKWNGTSWKSVSTLPYKFYRGSAVVLDGEIHILGSTAANTLHYKWNGTSWTSVSTLPYNFYQGSAVVLDGEIHILGSSASSCQTNHYKWNGTSWTNVSTLPYLFVQGSAVELNGDIHIFGCGDSSYYTNHYKWDGSTWTSVSTLPYSFFNGSVVVLDGEIHILGSGDSSYYTAHYVWNNLYWTIPNGLPYAFKYGSAVELDGEIHIMGGYDGMTNHYKWDGTSWTSVSTLPYNFYYGSAVVLDGEIHIMGSAYDSSTTVIYHYKWNGSSWESVSTLPYDFYDSSAIVLDGEIHILGSSRSGNETKHYKWDGSSWVSVSSLPYNFYGGVALVLDGEIHILGSQNNTNYKNHYKWDGSSWTSVSTLPYDFYNGSAVVLDGEIHIMGSNNSSYQTSHYKWNGSSWTRVSTLPYNLYAGSAVVLDGDIYILGGNSSAYYISKYAFTKISRRIESIRLVSPNGEEIDLTYNVMGESNEIKDNSSFAYGNNLQAPSNQIAIGHYNNMPMSSNSPSSGTEGNAFTVGNGTATARANAFRVMYSGKIYGLASFNASGADYAEFFEWQDGNEDNEDRIGYFVTLNGEKIELANENDYILGITSGNPCIIGNSDECWRGRYIMDDYDRYIEETFEYLEDGEIKTGIRYKENPEYNPNQEYIERAKRKEWSTVGMMGVLTVRDDGTCQVNGFCKVTTGGIATACEYGANTYRVIKRVTDNIVKVLFK